MSAPSARNEQPWHFLVVNDRKLLDKIAEIHPYAKMCTQATLAIIPCVDSSIEEFRTYWVQNLSAASQNILLAASAFGLGSVWVGVYPKEARVKEIQSIFKLPNNIVPLNVIPIGHTDMKQEVANRYQADRVHYNHWQLK